MHRQGRPRKLLGFYRLLPEEKLKGKYNECEQEKKNANPVDAVHVLYEQ